MRSLRGRKPRPTLSPKLREGGIPRCPAHLDAVARNEWRRLARPLFEAGILTVADRAAFAAYCQSYSQWVEAVQRMSETPKLIKTPSGYAQQSPWLTIANKQLELMGRYMSELGITPASRSRVGVDEDAAAGAEPPRVIRVIFRDPSGISYDGDGNVVQDDDDEDDDEDRGKDAITINGDL